MTDEQVLGLMANAKWGKNRQRFACRNPKCDSKESYELEDFSQKCSVCKSVESVKVGTAFESTQIAPSKIFQIIFLLLDNLKTKRDEVKELNKHFEEYLIDKKLAVGDDRRFSGTAGRAIEKLRKQYLLSSNWISKDDKVKLRQKTVHSFIKRLAEYVPEDFEGDTDIDWVTKARNTENDGQLNNNKELYARFLQFLDTFTTPEGVIEALCKRRENEDDVVLYIP